MHRVLSFQMARNINESSEYVTKRLCFSFLFSVGFLCLLCGFLLGRFAAERSMEAQVQKMRVKLAGNGLHSTEYLQQLALRELEEATIDWQTSDSVEANAQRVNRFFSNLSFVHEVIPRAACVQMIVRGSREPDRYVILSVNGDGIAMALKLAEILNKIHTAHEWRPRRSLMFCVSLISEDVCPQYLPSFMQRRIMAYVAVRGRSLQPNSHVTLAGSDVMRSIAVQAIKTIPDSDKYLDHEIFGRRLSLDIPQVTFSLNEDNFAHNQTHQSLPGLRGIILMQMVSQTMWWFSESTVIQWEPSYFNETLNRVLESIGTDKFQDTKEKLRAALKTLLAAVKELNIKIDAMENVPMLCARMWNDMLLDLDRTLLCPDEHSRSRTDLIALRELLSDDDNASTYLREIAECYENASLLLQER